MGYPSQFCLKQKPNFVKRKELNLIIRVHVFQGYTENVLKDLAETSGGTSADQMRFVMRKVVENKDIRQENVLAKLRTTLTDLEQDDSYINNALRYIPPLRFSL